LTSFMYYVLLHVLSMTFMYCGQLECNVCNYDV
jgi:hypothetical protein